MGSEPSKPFTRQEFDARVEHRYKPVDQSDHRSYLSYFKLRQLVTMKEWSRLQQLESQLELLEKDARELKFALTVLAKYRTENQILLALQARYLEIRRLAFAYVCEIRNRKKDAKYWQRLQDIRKGFEPT
jgi:hypothetical protein